MTTVIDLVESYANAVGTHCSEGNCEPLETRFEMQAARELALETLNADRAVVRSVLEALTAGDCTLPKAVLDAALVRMGLGTEL